VGREGMLGIDRRYILVYGLVLRVPDVQTCSDGGSRGSLNVLMSSRGKSAKLSSFDLTS